MFSYADPPLLQYENIIYGNLVFAKPLRKQMEEIMAIMSYVEG